MRRALLGKVIGSVRRFHRGYSEFSGSAYVPIGETAFSLSADPRYEIKSDLTSLGVFIAWACEEAWNPSYAELSAYRAHDPKGLNVLYFQEKPVAMLASVRHHEFGFMGAYRVHPDYRGKGMGSVLADFSLQRLSYCKGISIHAVLDQVDNYAKYGFQVVGSASRWAMDTTRFCHFGGPISLSYDWSFKRNLNLDHVVALDESVTGYRRENYWRYLFESADANIVGVHLRGQLLGVAVLLRCLEGFKFGAVYAPELPIAYHLISKMLKTISPESAKDTRLQIDIPSDTPYPNALATFSGFKKLFDVQKMVKGDSPDASPDAQYGIASLEIG